jgi:3-polyprenyl-4-hydroxybenzoate decarboxylase
VGAEDVELDAGALAGAPIRIAKAATVDLDVPAGRPLLA